MITGAAALAAYAAVDPAGAITPAQQLALLGGALPSWLLSPTPDIQISAQGCWAYGQRVSIGSLVSSIRSGPATDLLPSSPSGFAYTVFPANTPIFSSTYGLCEFQSATNYLLNSTAPATQTTGSLATGTYTLWVNGSGSASVAAGTATGTGFGSATNGSAIVFTISGAGTVVVTVTGSLNAFQLENSSGGTALIVTAGATVTRGNDSLAAIGVLNTLLKGSSVTQYALTNPLPSVALGATSNRIGAGFNGSASMASPRATPLIVTAFNGTVNTQTNIGNSGSFGSTLVATVTSFAPSSVTIVANYGTEVTAAVSFLTVTTTYLHNNANLNHLNGSTPVLGYYGRQLDATSRRNLSAANIVPQAVNAWGDSLTAGNQDGTGVTYPGVLGTLFSPGISINNQGVGGNTSTQIATRFAADLPYTAQKINVIWSGRNNFANSAQVQADIAAQVAAAPNSKALVLSIIPASTETAPNKAAIAALNSALQTTYGSKANSDYLDVWSLLVAAYNPVNGVDVIDHTANVPPFTLRAVEISGTIVGAINNTDTVFTTSVAVPSGFVLTVGTEYIYIAAASGTSVTSATRGYGGSIAASYGAGQSFVATDFLHLGAPGYTLVGQWVYDAIISNGWPYR